jgi:branched-chain amino acid transport system substrate-binding protein
MTRLVSHSLALATTLALTTALASATALAQLKIGVIASSTGATAVVGIPQKNSAALLPKKIGDLTVEYLVYDDASDATQTVILVKKLLAEQKIDALIGPSGAPNSVSVVPLVAEAATPMLAPVGAPRSCCRWTTRSGGCSRPPRTTASSRRRSSVTW